MYTVCFPHPEPPREKTSIWPVFLPFAGCPYRCIYCAQNKQTGSDGTDLNEILRTLECELTEAHAAGRGPYGIAFYGGTFTALPAPWPDVFLGLAQRFREKGLINHIRCSTRPDCVEVHTLSLFKARGLDMVELGIQSFDDRALFASGRGYTGAEARAACERVQASGLELGIQLLPGLPGDRDGVFQEDVCLTAELQPEIARFYPCVVIEGTPLKQRWREGLYTPWTVEHACEELAVGLLTLWERGVRVIRLGLPPEGTLEGNILAGPWHPALGQSVRGRALFEIVRRRVSEIDFSPELFEVPRRYQGELFGHAGELVEAYAALGLGKERVRYVDAAEFVLYPPW